MRINCNFVLYICAGLLLSGGTILGGFTAWNLVRMSYYFWTTDLGVELGSSALFIVGALLCLPTCWLATLVPYNPKSSTLMTTLMALATVAMLMLSLGLSSMMALSRAVREPTALNNSMQLAMTYDSFDPSVRSAFTAMQRELKCCGVHSFAEWYQHRRTLPTGCCCRLGDKKAKRLEQCKSPIYAVGCLGRAVGELRRYANCLTVLACTMVVILGITLFMAAYILGTNIVEKGEFRFKSAQQFMGISYVHPPIVSVTSPVALPKSS